MKSFFFSYSSDQKLFEKWVVSKILVHSPISFSWTSISKLLCCAMSGISFFGESFLPLSHRGRLKLHLQSGGRFVGLNRTTGEVSTPWKLADVIAHLSSQTASTWSFSIVQTFDCQKKTKKNINHRKNNFDSQKKHQKFRPSKEKVNQTFNHRKKSTFFWVFFSITEKQSCHWFFVLERDGFWVIVWNDNSNIEFWWYYWSVEDWVTQRDDWEGGHRQCDWCQGGPHMRNSFILKSAGFTHSTQTLDTHGPKQGEESKGTKDPNFDLLCSTRGWAQAAALAVGAICGFESDHWRGFNTLKVSWCHCPPQLTNSLNLTFFHCPNFRPSKKNQEKHRLSKK